MRPYLLDTNILVALAWPNHVHHHESCAWFASKAMGGFRTCPFTQAGFVRISSNQAFIKNAVRPLEALALLDRITKLRGHEFWPDDLPANEAFADDNLLLIGHRQITDAYLLALAHRNGGILATLDRGVAALARNRNDIVEIIDLQGS